MADDKHDDKKPDEKKAKAAPKLVPNAEGNVMVQAIMGPYRGQNLTMTAADGQAAIDDHWARDPTEALYEHDELDEAHRKEAWDASHAWAQAQWDAAAGVDPPPPEPPPEEGGVAHRRSMAPEPGGTYTTRHAEPAKPAPKKP